MNGLIEAQNSKVTSFKMQPYPKFERSVFDMKYK